MKPAALRNIMVALCLLAGATAAGAQSAARDPPARQQDSDRFELLFVAITVNGVPEGEYLVARRGGDFFVRPSDLMRWGVRVSAVATTLIENEAFVPLAGIAGMTLQFDAAGQRLALIISAELF